MDARIKFSFLRIGLAAIVLVLFPLAAQAQSERVQKLERKLQERDKVILELLERVETLERRVGVGTYQCRVQPNTNKFAG